MRTAIQVQNEKEEAAIEAKRVLTDAVTLMHTAGFSIQFNCFSGAYEIVEQDMKLDYALNNAKDCRV